jgi:hypothetical protein
LAGCAGGVCGLARPSPARLRGRVAVPVRRPVA